MRIIILGIGMVLALGISALNAEEIYLKNGNVISGKIISSDTEFLQVRTPYGDMDIKQEDIIKIEYVKQPEVSKKVEEKAAEAPEFIPKRFAIGFQTDLLGFLNFTMGPSIKFWIIPTVGIQGEFGILSFGSASLQTYVIKGFYGFYRAERMNVYAGGGASFSNWGSYYSNQMTSGFVGLFGFEYFPYEGVPLASAVEVGYYYGASSIYSGTSSYSGSTSFGTGMHFYF